jgi:hypothetical protein
MTKRVLLLTCVYVTLVLCPYIFARSRTSSEVKVKAREQTSTLRNEKLSFAVTLPAEATGKSKAKLRLRLLVETKNLPADTGLALSITTSRTVTFRTSPSFRIEGNIQTNGARSFFMRFSDPETHSSIRGFPAYLRQRVTTLPARASDTMTLRGLGVPMTLAEGVEYKFALVGSRLPISDPLPRTNPPGPSPTQLLYVANSQTGTITSYPLPLPAGTVNLSPTNIIAGIGLLLSHGMVVYDTNEEFVPSNQIFVNTTSCNLSFTCGVGPTISIYGKGQSAAPVFQYTVTGGPENTGVGPFWPFTALAVVSYNGLTQMTTPGNTLEISQFVGANVIDPTVNAGNPNVSETGYLTQLGGWAKTYTQGNTTPMFLPPGLIIQDVTQASFSRGDSDFYALVGAFLPLNQASSTSLGNSPASNLGILYWPGSIDYGPIPNSAVDLVKQFQNPTSIFASASSYSALNLPLFVTDSGSFNGGTDEVFIFARPLDSGNSAPWCAMSGPDTGLSLPQAVVTDANGNLYIANAGNNSITVYQTSYQNSQSSQGGCNDMVPMTTLYGDNTQLSIPISLAIGGP